MARDGGRSDSLPLVSETVEWPQEPAERVRELIEQQTGALRAGMTPSAVVRLNAGGPGENSSASAVTGAGTATGTSKSAPGVQLSCRPGEGEGTSLARAAASLGANPRTTFFRIIMPLILPGVISGALFAFVTSFDEVVAVLFIAGPDQQTIPRQMWNGIREQISPAILAVATLLVIFSIALLATVEVLRRRGERLRGLTPA